MCVNWLIYFVHWMDETNLTGETQQKHHGNHHGTQDPHSKGKPSKNPEKNSRHPPISGSINMYK